LGSNTEEDCGNEREDRFHGKASDGGGRVESEPTPKFTMSGTDSPTKRKALRT
jgi:hypothetical protein